MRWVVLGASGFVGSAVLAALQESGQDAGALVAPRLASNSDAVSSLVDEARGHPVVADLAAQLRGAGVVVVAAGLATPDARWEPELVGANALLPGVVALACDMAGVSRMVHLSSAAVQGRTHRLDETATTEPFSPYSRSKSLGEGVLDALRGECATELVVVRATSVQGAGRRTTAGLQRVARSRIASVAGAGTAPSPVSTVTGLAAFVEQVGHWPEPVPGIVLQPWTGLTTAEVLRLAGGQEPRHLPTPLCRALVRSGYLLSRVLGRRFDGPVRRVEALWFGQVVDDAWARHAGLRTVEDVAGALGSQAR